MNESNEDWTSEKELGTFDTEIWYVRKGVDVNIYVEGDFEKDRQGVAAVMVNGILCSLELSVARGSQLLKVIEVNLGVALLGTRNEETASSSHRRYLNPSVTNTSQ